MDSIHTITLDLHSTSAPVSLSVKKGDTGRQIHITLTEGSTPYKIAPGCYAVFAGTKPDDKVLWNACTIKGDTIIYELTAQTVAVVGWIPVQIRLYGAGGKLLQSPDFVLIVDAPAVEDNTVVTVSDNEVTALTQLVTECTALKADLDKFKMGGYYVPVVDQPTENTIQFSWMASGEGLPAVPPAVVELPGGSNDSGQNAGVHIGPEPPEDTSLLWIDTEDDTEDEDPLEGYYTSTETDTAIKSYVDTALGVIENGSY